MYLSLVYAEKWIFENVEVSSNFSRYPLQHNLTI